MKRYIRSSEYSTTKFQSEIDWFCRRFLAKYENMFPGMKVSGRAVKYPSDPNDPEIYMSFSAEGTDSWATPVLFHDLDSGHAEEVLLQEFRYLFPADKDKFTSKNIIRILQENGIDTTKHQYQFTYRSYQRHGYGQISTKHFNCYGDYLSYFSLQLGGSPTPSKIKLQYETLENFEEFVRTHPSVESIYEYARSNWDGDGSDLILELKNMDTREILYEGEDEYQED